MIVLKIFDNIKIDDDIDIVYLDHSMNDKYPFYGMTILSFDEDLIFDFFLNYSKLITHIRIFKLMKVRKQLTENQQRDFKILQFLKDNYNKISIIDKY